MIKLFTLRQPVVYLLLVVMIFVLRLPGFWGKALLSGEMSNYTFFGGFFSFLNQTTLSSYLIGCTIIILQTLHLNYIFEKHGVHYKSTFLPALFYVLYTSLFNEMDGGVLPALIAQTPLMLALEIYFDLYKAPDVKDKIFKAMLSLGIGVLIYTPLAYLIVVFWICIFFFKIPSVRDFVIATAGAVIPLYFAFVYYYFIGNYPFFESKISLLWQYKIYYTLEQTMAQRILLIALGLIILMASVKLYTNYFKNIIKTRIIQQMFFVLSFITLLLLIFLLQFQFQHLLIFSLPFCYILSYFFMGKWRFYLDEFLALGLFIFIVTLKFASL